MVRAYTIANGAVSVRMRDPANPGSGSPERAGVFLDRDGVINSNAWYINTPDEFQLLPGAAAAIRRLNAAGVPVVVVTNQGGVALGYVTEKMVGRIHDRMDELLSAEGAHVDAVYASLAYPDGAVPSLSIESPYRKPAIGMLAQARDDLGIGLLLSTMVGDATTDILAGQRAGCRTILVRTGFAGEDGWAEAKPDAVVADLPAACDLILNDQECGTPPDA